MDIPEKVSRRRSPRGRGEEEGGEERKKEEATKKTEKEWIKKAQIDGYIGFCPVCGRVFRSLFLRQIVSNLRAHIGRHHKQGEPRELQELAEFEERLREEEMRIRAGEKEGKGKDDENKARN